MPIVNVDELQNLRNKYCTHHLRSGYDVFKGYTLANGFKNVWKDIEELEVYNDDVWVCTFPKCGTTWTQEMVWCICKDLDFEAAKEDIYSRFPFLELSSVFDDPNIMENSINIVRNLKRPRFIKTHLPWELLPKQIRSYEKRPKIIHVARNPMDTCVSFYHQAKFMENFQGGVDLFAQFFLKDLICWTPYDKNILGYWNRRTESNILFIMYEDMKSDLSAVIDKVSKFLDVHLSEEGKARLLSHLSFASMKNNASTDHSSLVNFLQNKELTCEKGGQFMRSGKIGGFRNEMSEDIINMFNKRFIVKMEEEGLKFSI